MILYYTILYCAILCYTISYYYYYYFYYYYYCYYYSSYYYYYCYYYYYYTGTLSRRSLRPGCFFSEAGVAVIEKGALRIGRRVLDKEVPGSERDL